MRRTKLKIASRALLAIVRERIGSGRYVDTRHSLKRRKERDIQLPELLEIVGTMRHEATRDQFDPWHKQWKYCLRGQTAEGRDIRVVVALLDDDLFIVTAMEISRPK